MSVLTNTANASVTPELSFLGAAKRQPTPPAPDGRILSNKVLLLQSARIKANNAAFKSVHDDFLVRQDPKAWSQFPGLKQSSEAALQACMRFQAFLERNSPACLVLGGNADTISDQVAKGRQMGQQMKALSKSQEENLGQDVGGVPAVRVENNKLRGKNHDTVCRCALLQKLLQEAEAELAKAKKQHTSDQERLLRLQKEKNAEAEKAKNLGYELSISRADVIDLQEEIARLTNESARTRTNARGPTSKLSEWQKAMDVVSRRAEQANHDFEQEKTRLVRDNKALDGAVLTLSRAKKSLLEEATRQRRRADQLHRKCAQLISTTGPLQAQCLESQLDVMRFEHHEYLSAVQSAEQEGSAKQLREQLESALTRLDQTTKRASTAEELNIVLAAERDDARDVALHALKIAWTRFSALRSQLQNVRFKLSSGDAEVVETSLTDDPMPQIQEVIGGSGESVNGKDWQEPSAICVEDDLAHTVVLQQYANEERQTAKSQSDTDVTTESHKDGKIRRHSPTKDDSPLSANHHNDHSISTNAISTTAARTRQPPKHPRSWDEEPIRPAKRLDATRSGRKGRMGDSYRPSY